MWLFLVENVVFIGVDPKININLGRTDLASEFFIFLKKSSDVLFVGFLLILCRNCVFESRETSVFMGFVYQMPKIAILIVN